MKLILKVSLLSQQSYLGFPVRKVGFHRAITNVCSAPFNCRLLFLWFLMEPLNVGHRSSAAEHFQHKHTTHNSLAATLAIQAICLSITLNLEVFQNTAEVSNGIRKCSKILQRLQIVVCFSLEIGNAWTHFEPCLGMPR